MTGARRAELVIGSSKSAAVPPRTPAKSGSLRALSSVALPLPANHPAHTWAFVHRTIRRRARPDVTRQPWADCPPHEGPGTSAQSAGGTLRNSHSGRRLRSPHLLAALA